jgi:hypothetical protein
VQRRYGLARHPVGFLYLVKYDHGSTLLRLARQCLVGANLEGRDYRLFADQTRVRINRLRLCA